MSYQSINPYNSELVRTFDEQNDRQLETAIATAANCFESWRRMTYSGRACIVSKAAAIMRERAGDFARPATLEMGKLYTESVGEVMLSADILDYYATNAERFLAQEHLDPDTGEAVVESSPLGVLFGVQPWNFPYYQLARFAAPNLMAGNVVLVKHSGSVPQCAIAFEELWREAGAPEGAYTNLLISHDQVLAVIDDPRNPGRRADRWPRGSEGRGCESRDERQKIHDGAGRQRCLHRVGGRGSGDDSHLGHLGKDEQHGPVLHRGETLHRCRSPRGSFSGKIQGGHGSARAR